MPNEFPDSSYKTEELESQISMTPASSFQIESPAFKNNEKIPIDYTCEGKDIPPPLQWFNAPSGTKSFALIVEDPDAPDPKAPKGIWSHWLVYNIPVNISSLDEAIPDGAETGVNDFKKKSWGGPCPPIGIHRYFYRIFALDTVLSFNLPPLRMELEAAMKEHILAEAELIGLYEKQKQ